MKNARINIVNIISIGMDENKISYHFFEKNNIATSDEDVEHCMSHMDI